MLFNPDVKGPWRHSILNGAAQRSATPDVAAEPAPAPVIAPENPLPRQPAEPHQIQGELPCP
jgi:hypothetical protein